MKPHEPAQRATYEFLFTQSDAYEAPFGMVVLDATGRLRRKGQPIRGAGAWYRVIDDGITGVGVPAVVMFHPSEVVEPTDEDLRFMAAIAATDLGVELHETSCPELPDA